ncbi:MAG: enoyl-CoA hydratase/isomerase family protein [Candidatus Lokiarchaeota archaeon]|nr:enoyl-CoA hydratase/isomerase family protein [Candidatus Lokiarchaeota archaeon]
MSINNLDFGEHIEFSVKKRFGIITLDRTQRSNAFTQDQLWHLKEAIEYCQNDSKIRGLVLTNNGSSFSTGMDLDAVDGADHVAVKKLEGTAADICKLLFNGKPAICAINGRTLGEGVVFSICCDYRIAVKNSFFQMPEIFSGIFPGTGCVILFSKIIGIPWTKKMLMFSEKISAIKALEIGLIDQIVDSKDQLMEESMKKARFLFSKNQTVLQAIKLCSNHFLDKSYNNAYEIEKIASGWYEHEDKEIFIREFKKKLE